ncbi:AMP-binding protein, partial [Streptomyces sp. OR43]|uniref:AMP-binding protein n=1 Tax=Streptomyces sp. or43 TaxID=2478957 RepID=UPI0011CE78F8
MPLLPALQDASAPAAAREAVRFDEVSLSYAQLAAAADSLAARIAGADRVAVWATPTAQTVVAVVAALRAGVPAVPLNPRTGERELAHIVADSAPATVLASSSDALPPALAGLRRLDVAVAAPAGTDAEFPEPSPASPA